MQKFLLLIFIFLCTKFHIIKLRNEIERIKRKKQKIHVPLLDVRMQKILFASQSNTKKKFIFQHNQNNYQYYGLHSILSNIVLLKFYMMLILVFKDNF